MQMSNTLFLVSGPSGSGKTSIMRRTGLPEVVSFTTRPMRNGEVDGVDYNFITLGEFEQLRDDDGLVESSNYADNHYGITKQELYGKLEHSPAFAIVDYPGMKQLRELVDDYVLIFIYADEISLSARMFHRGDSDEHINKRLSTYEDEIANRVHYDYVLRNPEDKLDDVVDIVGRIIAMEVLN